MATSWLCTGYGSWNSGAWNGEIATVSYSGAARDSGSFSAGAINESLPVFDAVATGTNGSTTHCTVNYGSEGVGAWNNTNQNAIAEAMWTFLNAIKTYQNNAFSWKEIRISAIEGSGAVVNGASVYTITAPLVGNSSNFNPPQLAVVNSHVTGGRGPRNRGRLYMPYGQGNTSVATDGLVGSSLISALNSASKAYINTVNAISGIRTAVVSKTHQTYSDIVSVRTGDEFDTQRRRRNARRETYTSLAV